MIETSCHFSVYSKNLEVYATLDENKIFRLFHSECTLKCQKTLHKAENMARAKWCTPFANTSV